MTFCDGGGAEYVSGDKSRHWWRCPSCRWVGWVTTSPDIPATIGSHVGAHPGAVSTPQPVVGQLDLFGVAS